MKLGIIVALVFLNFPALSQIDSAAVNLSTPYHSIYTHLYYLQDDSYAPELSAKTFNQKYRSAGKASELAIELKQVLDGKGIYITMSEIPKDPNYLDSTTNRHQYILTEAYPNIYLEKVRSKWLFSERSAVAIEQAHKDLFRFGTDRLLNLLPKIGTRKIFGLYSWQVIGILILSFFCFLIHRVFTFLIKRLFVRLLRRHGHEDMARNFILPIARPISIFLVILILVTFIPVLQLPIEFSKYLILILRAILPLVGTIVAYRLADIFSLYLLKLASKTESTLDDQLVPLLRKTLKTFVIILGTFVILSNLNVDIWPLLTGISIGGLAFALAAQDTIKNFFGSLMIFIDKPFQIGHWITSDNIDGEVEEVGIRSTRVRTFRNSLVYVPNGKLADSVIDNHGLRVYRRFYTQISVTYDTPADILELFSEGLREIVKNHPKTMKEKYHIYVNDFASSSINIMFYIFFAVPTWAEELKSRHEVILAIIRLADQLSVNFAFPTQTIHVENLPGQPSLSPSYKSKEELKAMMADYFQSN